ncbi:hypothetical protein E8E95_02345 [Pseudomonas sp. BN414]|uniref:hypothetical protein n=1 Tax=Pseudomonas sp. BN414 TaxID=2567888 RepID=UPI002458682B|nr:hypothetical protein [Pseudomonas sp. BN414]MDH4565518.1 hypothetical protein [Pseudomonas sp. BN414]
MFTIEDVINLRNKGLKTASSKIIYLMIRNNTNEEGWSTISTSEFSAATSLTVRAVFKVLGKLKACGLIEQNPNKEHPNSINQFRIIEL